MLSLFANFPIGKNIIYNLTSIDSGTLNNFNDLIIAVKRSALNATVTHVINILINHLRYFTVLNRVISQIQIFHPTGTTSN